MDFDRGPVARVLLFNLTGGRDPHTLLRSIVVSTWLSVFVMVVQVALLSAKEEIIHTYISMC